MNAEHGGGRSPTRGVMGSLFRITAGAGLMVAGAYAVSRVTQQRARESRVARLEAILKELTQKEASGGG
jgi:hypothetical protein